MGIGDGNYPFFEKQPYKNMIRKGEMDNDWCLHCNLDNSGKAVWAQIIKKRNEIWNLSLIYITVIFQAIWIMLTEIIHNIDNSTKGESKKY